MLSRNPSDPKIDSVIDDIKLDVGAILGELTESTYTLNQIARNHKLSLPQLVAWCRQPAVRKFLDEADELDHRRAATKAAHSRQLALTVLIEHCNIMSEAPRDREIASKAARSLLRYNGATPTSSQSEPSGANRRSHRPPANVPPDLSPGVFLEIPQAPATAKVPSASALTPASPAPRRDPLPVRIDDRQDARLEPDGQVLQPLGSRVHVIGRDPGLRDQIALPEPVPPDQITRGRIPGRGQNDPVPTPNQTAAFSQHQPTLHLAPGERSG